MTAGHGEKLPRKRSQVIAALLTERTIAEASAKVGVSESTVLRWMRRPDFQEAYRAARRSIVDCVVAQVQQAATEAVSALRKNLQCGTPGAEVQAARVLLDTALRGVELGDLQSKVEELDRLLAELKGREANQPRGEAAIRGPGTGGPPQAGGAEPGLDEHDVG
jgi:hypothetical protein